MSDPINHHWLPQCLMSPWCTDGKVMRFYRPHDKVVSGRKSPKGIGAIDHLYTINWKLFGDPFLIEKNIMSKALDDPFARVRDEMLLCRIPAGDTERRSFAQFMIMLIARHPNFIIGRREETAKKIFEIFKNIPRTVDGVTRRMSEDEAAELYRQTYQGYEDYLIMSVNIETALSSDLIPEIIELDWRVIDVSNTGFSFVLGDNPVQIFRRDGILEHVEFPLSPHHLFLAGTKTYFRNEDALREEFLNIFVLRVNRHQLEKATDFALARDCGPNDCYLKIAEEAMPRRSGSANP